MLLSLKGKRPFLLQLIQIFPMLYVMQAQRFRNWWNEHRTGSQRLALVLMMGIGLVRLGYELWRLLLDTCPPGANDLFTLYVRTHNWFSGAPFPSMYPPASYPLFWLFYGWLPLGAARWLWALTSAALLIGLAFFLIKAIESKISFASIFCVTFLLAIYPTAITIGNGQLTLHVMYPLLMGVLLAKQKERHWRTDLFASLLILFALVKPSITLPFLWIVLFASGSLRILMPVASGYAALTLFGFSFREEGWMGFLQSMKFHSSGIFTHRGYANLYAWFGELDLEAWAFPVALVVFVTLGIWCYRHRHSDLWLQLGVAAIVARFWVYHRLYDDLLIILPMIALLRIARNGPQSDDSDMKAGILLFLSWAALLIPGTLYRLPSPWGVPFKLGQALIWMAMLIFLLCRAERMRGLNLEHPGRFKWAKR
jgi:hypothetical protein